MTPLETQTAILEACHHDNAPYHNDVTMGNGRELHVCNDCWNASVATYRSARKAELANEPRCEVPGCNRRGTLTVAYTTLMCKKHYDKASAELMRRCAGLWMGVVVPNKADLIDLATA